MPGRVCLFGDHQDYLGLPVIACAIDRFVQVEVMGEHVSGFQIIMPDIGAERYIPLTESFENLAPRDYFGSAIRVLRQQGLFINRGYCLRISGDIPINSGLSSSSAVCLAWIDFLCKTYSNRFFGPEDLARLAHQAEVLEHGEPGGMMDQYSIAYGGVIHLKTKEPYQVTTIDIDIPGLVIGNSGVEKKTIDVLRQARISGLEAISLALEFTSKQNAAELSSEDLDEVLPKLPKSLQPYFRAAVGNHLVTQAAFRQLRAPKPDWPILGRLMSQHQAHLRDDLRVSVPVIDCLIREALDAGALGAKLVGSGGGGCIVALAPEREEEVEAAMLGAGAVEAFSARIS